MQNTDGDIESTYVDDDRKVNITVELKVHKNMSDQFFTLSFAHSIFSIVNI